MARDRLLKKELWERRVLQREDRGAEMGGAWGGVVLFPSGEGSREGAVSPPQKNLSILHLK